jgi:hypothetical protein
MFAKAGKTNNNSFRNIFFAVPTPRSSGRINISLTLIIFITSIIAKNAIISFFFSRQSER